MRNDLLPKTFEGKLGHLTEECAEVILAVAKYQRFGATATDPVTGQYYNNISKIWNEIDDLKSAIARMFEAE